MRRGNANVVALAEPKLPNLAWQMRVALVSMALKTGSTCQARSK